MKDEVNIKKLAKELNISISTVSRALRDAFDVSKETKQKVLALAREWNYHPNPYASSLRKQRSKTIAVILPEIANSFFSLVINGIHSVVQEKGYHVLIYLTYESFEQEKAIVQHLQNGRVDGILISLSSETTDTSHLQHLQERGFPIVFFDRVDESNKTARVTTDDYDSSFKATEHLIEQGCRKIAYLLVSKNLSIGKNRMRGYTDALQKYNLPFDQKLVIDGSGNNQESYELIRSLMEGPDRPDGIFASVERLAITCYQVCYDLNISIPSDVKILSFSNLESAPFLNPPLTTVTQPAFDIGKEAATILFKALHKKHYSLSNEISVLKSELIKRGSTGKI